MQEQSISETRVSITDDGERQSLGSASALGHWIVALTGLAIVAASFPLGKIRDSYGSYRRWVSWIPGRTSPEARKEERRAA